MSGRLVSAVFDSALPAWLKPYAAAFASFAADDGERVYPTIGRVARMVGKSTRSTQRALHELRLRGVLVLVRAPGPHYAARYALRAIALPHPGDPEQLALFPQAAAPQIRRNSATRAEFSTDIHRFPQGGVTPVTRRGDMGVTRSVSDPLRTTPHLNRARAREGKYPKTGT